MNRPASAIEAISPAIQHVKTILFRPFEIGRWIILGFLTFLQILGEGGGSNTIRLPGQYERGADEAVREGVAWVAEHWTLVAILGFFGILCALILIVLFKWLSSRATFCYLDCVATNRAEVVRPWREHGQLADSYFFFRLVLSLCILVILIMLLVPIGVSLWQLIRSGEELSFWNALFGSGVVAVSVLLLVIVLLLTALLRVILVDFVTPVQYMHRIRCLDAFRVVLGLIKNHLGAFVLYILLKILIAIVVGFGVLLLGCFTCCIAFCCMIIPVIGQALLQPLYVFNRAFPLFFLRGFGPEFDIFAGVAPGGVGPGGAPPGGAGPDVGGGWTRPLADEPRPAEPGWSGPTPGGTAGGPEPTGSQPRVPGSMDEGTGPPAGPPGSKEGESGPPGSMGGPSYRRPACPALPSPLGAIWGCQPAH